jgi:dTDP-4-dehydrorhamnose reductase
MRAIVVGGSGQIGGWLLHHLSKSGHEAIGTFRTVPTPGLVRLDTAEPAEARRLIDEFRPDVVFYPAGFTWVDGCEREPGLSRAANVEQPLAVAAATAHVGGRFLTFSTDYVFDGAGGPYDEHAPTNPLNVYGRDKLETERALAADHPSCSLVIRTGWVFGPERQGKNFAYQVVRNLRKGQEVVCPSDMTATPSYGPDVAASAVRLAERGATGLIHVAGPDVVSRDSFARSIAAAFDLDPSRIVGRPDAELPRNAARPLWGGLVSRRHEDEGAVQVRGLGAALLDFRREVETGPDWADPRA